MGDPRPLTTEEAGGLAQRWVAVRLYEIAMQEWRDGDRTERPEPPPFWALDDPECERLFAWVRSELTQAPASRTMAARNFYLAERLGLTVEQADALRRAAGWPS